MEKWILSVLFLYHGNILLIWFKLSATVEQTARLEYLAKNIY